MDNQALSNALGVQVQSPEAHGGPGGTATDSSRRNSRPPSKKPGSSGRSTRGGGKNSAAKDLKDPELYEALMKECVQEEALMAEANHQGRKKTKIYKAPSFVTQYLARNDVRPMKKVFRSS